MNTKIYLILAFLGMSLHTSFGQIFADNRPIERSAYHDTLRVAKAKNAQLLQEEPTFSLEEGEGQSKRANKLYKQLGYKASAEIYQKLNKKGALDEAMMARLAKSYRLNSDFENAEYWYSKIVNEAAEPSTIFHYAQALQSNGKCEDAVRWYQVFNNKVKKKEQFNLEFIENCDELTTFMEREDVVVSNISSINSESIDYCAVPFKEGVVFTSTRGLSGVTQNMDNWTKESFSDLFYAKKNEDGSYNTPTSLASDVNGRFHDGVASFTSGQNRMFFSRNNRSGKNKKGIIDLKVYQAQVDDNNVWTKATELPFNSDEFASCHPSITPDGKKIYFASDRPGGFGGMDIYTAEWTGSAWSTPTNLGPTVNTIGNEIFPTIHTDGTLFFASNGHRGMGGLDIFAVKKANDADENSWVIRTNIGQPFNTPKDDFGFSTSADATRGYITSNRAGGRGEDDIYEWKSEEPIDFFSKERKPEGNTAISQLFSVVELNSKVSIPEAVVTFEMSDGTVEPVYYTSDAKGELSHLIMPGKTYRIIVEKEGYIPTVEEISGYALLQMVGKVFELPMERRACTEVNGLVMNLDCNKPLADATIRVFNKCTGEEEVITTNRAGKFDTCLKCGCDYEVIGSKDNFTEDRTILTTLRQDCDQSETFDVTLNVKSIPIPKKKFVGVPTSEELTVGSVITLNNIYYDFDRYKIRSDASTDLDDVVRLMSENPSMEIELGSHTDARGTNMYNNRLSLERANAAVEYLVKRGVEPYRIVAKGYGESQLTNHCDNGVQCTDDEHQQNRRTEIRITKFDNPTIQIRE